MKTLDTDLLAEMTRRLVDEFHPEQIILFGSHAWGTPNEDSDIDLFVIVPESDLSPTQRATRAYRALRGIRVEPTDIVVRTHAEVERHRHVHTSLASQVLEQGKVYMGKSHSETVRTWFIIAKRDLDSARRLASGPDPYLDIAIYHCQQAAEKAVKGFLAFHNQAFPKTHDVRKVVALAGTIEPRFVEWLDAGELLTPFATAFRSTDDILEPSQDEFDQALQSAADLYAFVLSLLPTETHPTQ